MAIGCYGPLRIVGLLFWLLLVLPIGCFGPPVAAGWLFWPLINARFVFLTVQLLPGPPITAGLYFRPSNFCSFVIIIAGWLLRILWLVVLAL